VDVAVCTGLPVTLVFLPAADIAAYVGPSVPLHPLQQGSLLTE